MKSLKWIVIIVAIFLVGIYGLLQIIGSSSPLGVYKCDDLSKKWSINENGISNGVISCPFNYVATEEGKVNLFNEVYFPNQNAIGVVVEPTCASRQRNSEMFPVIDYEKIYVVDNEKVYACRYVST